MTSLEKQTIDRSYHTTMDDVRSELGPLESTWSKAIHSPILASIGSILTATILRPRPLIVGAVTAIFFVLAAYLLVRLYGYQVSGFESVLGFTTGWLVGAAYSFSVGLSSRFRLK